MRANCGAVLLFRLLRIGLAEPLPPAFAKQLRCPFARVWLEHGPERAAEMLGVAPHTPSGRQLGLDPLANGTGSGGGGKLPRCLIGPGVFGAAHQMGYSLGYSNNCPGTPAQKSPYAWPLRWTAIVEQKDVTFRSDVVTYETHAKVWYMLDKNWKRMDTFYQRGVERDMGQLPCESHGNSLVNGTTFACNRTNSANTTMLHRNNRIVFIEWATNGSIGSCWWLNAGVLGNVRPDWFMDDRGDSTGVQYLGDSHVYYLGEPRLVKQWRKKDFADQYHTMSMQRLPGADGIHWPLILNAPGEGYGDDFLVHWHSHRVLNESEASEFWLDEAYIRSGGSCPERAPSRDVAAPTDQSPQVPGNLVVEPIAWHESVYTASPVWTPPASPEANDGGSAAMAQDVDTGISATSCFDAATSTLRLSLAIQTASPTWAAIGFRRTEDCLMVPRGGGDGEIVYMAPDANDAYEVYYGPLSPDLQRMQGAAIRNFMRRMTPVRDAASFVSSSAGYSNGALVLSFFRTYTSMPAVFNLSYALGADRSIGYHKRSGCFAVTPVACPAVCLLAQGSGVARQQGGGAQHQGSGDHSQPTSGARLPGPPWVAVFALCFIFVQLAQPRC